MGSALAAACLAAVCAPVIAAAQHETTPEHQEAQAQLSREASELIARVMRTGEHDMLPFAVVDKKDARLYVFDAQGRLQGESAALIGEAMGDDIAPGVGEHAQTGEVPLAERTTPAGRFVSQPGRNRSGEHVIWVDYDSAFAIHRVRPGRSRMERLSRLASRNPLDRRTSLGCVVVPEPFYEQVVRRWLGQGRSVVYVMPESAALEEAALTEP